MGVELEGVVLWVGMARWMIVFEEGRHTNVSDLLTSGWIVENRGETFVIKLLCVELCQAWVLFQDGFHFLFAFKLSGFKTSGIVPVVNCFCQSVWLKK